MTHMVIARSVGDELIFDQPLKHGLNEPIAFMAAGVILKIYLVPYRRNGVDPLDAERTDGGQCLSDDQRIRH